MKISRREFMISAGLISVTIGAYMSTKKLMRLGPYWVSIFGNAGVSDPYPGITVYDQFLGSDGTGLDAHAPNKAPVGSVWEKIHGDWDIQSNRANLKTRGDTPNLAIAAIQSGLSNCTISGIVNRSNTTNLVGIIFRLSSLTNWWVGYIGSTAYGLMKWVNSSPAIVGTVSKTPSLNTDYAIQIVLNGNSITMTVDGGDQITASDSFNATATKHGLYGEAALKRYDDFQVMP